MSVSLMCISLLAFLGIGLGFAVSMTRSKTEVNFGSSPDPDDSLYKIMRAHGNTMEYAPLMALLIYILSQIPQPTWVTWFMILATFSRYLIVAGMIFPRTMAERNPMRFIGALGTYICGFGLCAGVFLQAMGA